MGNCGDVSQHIEPARSLVSYLLPWIADGVTFLTEEGVPLLDRLCSEFTAADGIRTLWFTEPEQLGSGWKNGNLRSCVDAQLV